MSDNLPVPFTSRADLLVGDSAYIKKLQSDPAITDEQWAELETWAQQNVTSPVQPSIICKGSDCIYVTSCPLSRAEIPLPENDPCVVEETVKRNWLSVYLPEVGNSTDGYKIVDTGMVIDLVSTLLDIHRAQGEVSDMPNVAERVLRGFDAKGKPITDLKMNPLHFYLANARKLKMKILDTLVATRDARKKDKSRTSQDATQLLTEMRATIETLAKQKIELKEQLEIAQAQVIDSAPLGLEDEDDGAAPTT